MTFAQQNETYKYNQEEEAWTYNNDPLYPSLSDPSPPSSTIPPQSSQPPHSSQPSAQNSDYPSLYTTLFVDTAAKERRERDGREEEKWDGVEAVYHTTPYPPPRRGSGSEVETTGPYPTVQIWRPPSAKWYQKQAVGKFVGKIQIIIGSMVFKDYVRHAVLGTLHRAKVPKPGAIIAGVLCIGFGIYLHLKKYLRDPKAVVHYRQKIFAPTTQFQNVVDEFGWDKLFVIATKEELCYKLYQEMQNVRGLYQICSIYKVNNLKAYLKYDVMRAIDVEARWEYDVQRAADGTGPELGTVVAECGDFLLTASNVQVDKIRESLESDPTMQRYSFAELFANFNSSIRRIFKKGFLSAAFLREKLIRQLSTDPTFQFSLIAKHRWIVDTICTPQEISHSFRIARENCTCIVSFLHTYWIWPIETYHSFIIPDDLEFSKLKQIYHEYNAFKESVQKDIDHINKRYSDNIEEARRVKDRKSAQMSETTRTKIFELQMNPQKDGYSMEAINSLYARQKDSLEKFKEEERAIQRKEKQTMEDQTRQADKELENKRIAFHKDWNYFLAQRKSYTYPSPPHIPQSFPFMPQYTAPSAPPPSAPFV